MLRFFARAGVARQLLSLVLAFGTYATALVLHGDRLGAPGDGFGSPYVHWFLAPLPPWGVQILALALLLINVLIIRAMLMRNLMPLGRGSVYLFLALVIAPSLVLTSPEMVTANLGFLLLLYGFYLLLLPGRQSMLASRLLRASIMLACAGLVYFPYNALFILPLVVAVHQGEFHVRTLLAWLAGLLIPHYFGALACYIAGVNLWSYIPYGPGIGLQFDAIISWIIAQPYAFGYWLLLFLIWLIPLSRPGDITGVPRNVYVLIRAVSNMAIFSLLAGGLLTGFPLVLSVSLGLLLVVPLSEFFYKKTRSFFHRLIFTTLAVVPILLMLFA